MYMPDMPLPLPDPSIVRHTGFSPDGYGYPRALPAQPPLGGTGTPDPSIYTPAGAQPNPYAQQPTQQAHQQRIQQMRQPPVGASWPFPRMYNREQPPLGGTGTPDRQARRQERWDMLQERFDRWKDGRTFPQPNAAAATPPPTPFISNAAAATPPPTPFTSNTPTYQRNPNISYSAEMIGKPMTMRTGGLAALNNKMRGR